MKKSRCALLVVDGDVIVKKFPLSRRKCIIGRAHDADLVLSSREVSRHHAVVHPAGKHYRIDDLNSTNGTVINGNVVRTHVLKPGDEIAIGDALIIFDNGSVKPAYFDETHIARRGGETAIIEDKFMSLQQKIKDKNLKTEFKDIEHVVRKSRKRLSSLVHEDKLTGLYNRHYFDKKAQEELARAQHEQTPLSILFIDIDHFKKINDTYGHKTGDKTLRIVSKLVRSSCRKSDIVARYGGEEIVVVLPNTLTHDAVKVASEIRTIIARQTRTAMGFRVTVSVGIATFPAHGNSLKALLDNADKALYRAKREGRNRVNTYNAERD